MRIIRWIALSVCLCLTLASCDSSKNKTSPDSGITPNSATEYQTSPQSDLDITSGSEITPESVALYIGEEPIYYREFNFHIVTQINTYATSEEGINSGFDPSLPLNEQPDPNDSERTIEDMVKEDTIMDLQGTIAMYLESKVNGYEKGEWEEENIQIVFDSLNTYIRQEGLTEEQALLNKYGIPMTHDQVYSIMERYLTGKSYEATVREKMVFTDQELETFYEQNKSAVLIPDCHAVDLRIIEFDTEQMALDVMEKFENGDKSEESFVEMVGQYTKDEAVKEVGGLYADLSPYNYSVERFDEVESWVFDNARKPGDYAVLDMKTGYGLMFFVQQGEPLWLRWSRYTMQNSEIQNIIEQYPVSYPEG